MRRIKDFFTNTFIGGVVVVLPILIFAYLINWIVSFFGNLVDPIVKLFPIALNIYFSKFIAFVVVLFVLFSIGLFIRTRIGQSFFSWFEENFLKKLPFYSTIRETVIQFIGNDKTPFSKVVLVKPYGGNAKMIGFVTSKLDEGRYTIFVPTAPNPTSGFVIILEEKHIEHLAISAEEAMRTIIGLGRGAENILNKDILEKKKK